MLKIPPTITYYKLAEQSTLGLGRSLECQKCNIIVITQALMLYLICTHSPLGVACPWASCIKIIKALSVCFTQNKALGTQP